MANDPTLRNLNDCGCCKGMTTLTPVTVRNRPGLSAIAYRVGVYHDFLESMESALTDGSNPALSGLKTRDQDDFSIALLDSWAVVADVLTFYQERIANESYLRTANERLSIVQLARELGYELNPGVAASTYLAFTMEFQAGSPNQPAPGAPSQTTVPIGTKVQSIPGPGEKPQTFETVEAIEADVALNQLRARHTEPRIDSTSLYLSGVATSLKPGDLLLFVNKSAGQTINLDDDTNGGALRALTAVTADNAAGQTNVTWENPLDPSFTGDWNSTGTKVFALRQHASLFGYNAQDWCALPVALRVGDKNPDPSTSTAQPFLPGAYHDPNQWAEATLSAGTTKINLDAVYNQIVKNSWVVLRGVSTDAPNRVCIPPPQSIPNQPIIPGVAGGLEVQPNLGAAGGVLGVPNVAAALGPALPAASGASQAIESQTPVLSPNLQQAARPVSAAIEGGTPIAIAPGTPIATQPGTPIGVGPGTPIAIGPGAPIGVGPGTPIAIGPGTPIGVGPGTPIGVGPGTPIAIGPGTPIAIGPGTPAGSQTPQPPASPSAVTQAYFALGIGEEPVARFNMSGKTTRVTIPAATSDQPTRTDSFSPRNTSVYGVSERLALAEMPISGFVRGSQITLDSAVTDIQPGHRLIVSGVTGSGPGIQPSDTATQVNSEMVIVKDNAADAGGRTIIDLADSTPLTFVYKPDSVKIYGNVAAATHGETTNEVLGSGDATQPYQQFKLRQSPLTYTSAPTASGGASTLQVTVDGIKWNEVPSLFGSGQRDRVYITRIDDSGTVSVIFGDGRTGARLSTGTENVSAAYRKGIGLSGMVAANQLSLLLTKPLGVRSVTNPTAPTGAQDPQVTADAKKNAPTTVLTLDRVVSLSDYEDFSRNFSGIAKALATWTWNIHSRGVFITVAGAAGAAVPEDSELHGNLVNAIQSLGNPVVPVLVKSYSPRHFQLSAQIKVDSAYETDLVLAAVATALQSSFSFEARDFGQPVTLSEVYEVIQGVAGVVAADITRLLLTNPFALIAAQQFSVEALPPVKRTAIGVAVSKAPIGVRPANRLPIAITPPALVSPILLAAEPQPGADAATAAAAELLLLDLNPSTDLGVMK